MHSQRCRRWVALLFCFACATAAVNCATFRASSTGAAPAAARRHTFVSISADSFLINGKPIYAGRSYNGMKVEGLLMNARMVQGVFDDQNPATASRWKYPSGPWDPYRNTSAFVAAMPAWRKAGLISFTLDLQGGCPYGYCGAVQPWDNAAFTPDGLPRGDYLTRLQQILDRADELGMVPILGLFYFGQESRLKDERAVVRAVQSITDWLTLDKGYSNVILEIANECDNSAYHPILQPPRAAELIRLVQRRSQGHVRTQLGRLLVSTSLAGMHVPPDDVIAASDFILLHGNGAKGPGDLRTLIDATRKSPAFRGQPVVVNEDDHYDFDKPDNNLLAAIGRRAGWGYFDFRRAGEGFHEGYQGVPTDWTIGSPRKIGFFQLLSNVTGG